MPNLISRKKEIYGIGDYLRSYLRRYGRIQPQQIRYEDLLRYTNSITHYDEQGKDSLWSTVFYSPTEQREIHDSLRLAYALIKADGDLSAVEQLYIDSIDQCQYANTLPFRIRIVNGLNENFDYFYIKKVDANRIYGLELEHILSPNRINYLINGDTIIEEHIIGMPADIFMKQNLAASRFDQVRLAKEFVKFNERCFVRLLGDMHSGNFVVDISLDFEKWHYRMRSMDFDQQSHHWRKEVYMPRCFEQNGPFIRAVEEHLAPENVLQYQKEERSLIAKRVRVSHGRFHALMEVMREDIISTGEHVASLRDQLARHYQYQPFEMCQTMGDLVYTSMQVLLDNNKPVTPPRHKWANFF